MLKIVIIKRIMPILLAGLLILGLPSAHCLDEPVVKQTGNGSEVFPEGSFSMELENADIRDVLRALAKESAFNIVLSEKVEGKITVNLNNVPFKDAFLSILRGAGLGYAVEGKIVRVDLLDTIQEEETKKLEAIKTQKEAEQRAIEAELKTREDKEKFIEFITVAVKVNYIVNSKATKSIAKELGAKKEAIKDLDGLKRALVKLIPKERIEKGASIEVLDNINTLLITDIPVNVNKMVKLIKKLDIPPKQVFIKARITELNTSSVRELGVRWGGAYRSGSPAKSYTSGSYTTDNGTTDQTTQGELSGGKYNITGGAGSDYIVNLPADVGLGSGGAVNFGFITDSLNLDVQLSALEDKGAAKVLASPQVITQDNQRAYIKSGEEIPYKEKTFAGGTSSEEVEFKDVAIELEVTPHIVKDDVFLDIVVARKEANRSISKTEPPINSRAMTTKVSVKSGETIVIGGLTTEDTSNSTSEVPYFAKIPVLGWFFKNKGKREEKMDLLIFITPSIIQNIDPEA